MGDDFINKVEKLSLNIERKEITDGEKPKTIAGCILFLICESFIEYQFKSLKDISSEVGIDENYIRILYQKIIPHK